MKKRFYKKGDLRSELLKGLSLLKALITILCNPTDRVESS